MWLLLTQDMVRLMTHARGVLDALLGRDEPFGTVCVVVLGEDVREENQETRGGHGRQHTCEQE